MRRNSLMIVLLVFILIGSNDARTQTPEQQAGSAFGGRPVVIEKQGVRFGVSEQARFETVGSTSFVIIRIAPKNGSAYDYWQPLKEVSNIKVFDTVADAEAYVEQRDHRSKSDDIPASNGHGRVEMLAREAELASANSALSNAEVRRQEYLEGTFKNEEKEVMRELALAQQELREAELEFQSVEGSDDNRAKERLTFGLANAKSRLEQEEARLWVLQNLTRKKMLVEFENEIKTAQRQILVAEARLREAKQWDAK